MKAKTQSFRCRGYVALAALAAGLLCSTASAEQYAVPILVDSEDDIFDLFDNGDITEPEMDLLMELYQRRVNINRATRDELYELPGLTYPVVDDILRARRDAGGRFSDLEELRATDVVPDIVLSQMEGFIEFGARQIRINVPVHGSVRLKGLYQPNAGIGATPDFDPSTLDVSAGNIRQSPSFGLRTRIKALDGRFNGSWTVLARDRPGPLSLSGTAEEPYLIARGQRFGLEPLRKAYASYESDIGDRSAGHVVIGNFNAGFGERLTFDTTNRRRPYGLYGDDLVFDNVGGLGNFNSDFRVHRGLQGAAGSIQQLPLGGNTTLDLTGFVSMRAVDEYMYRYQPNRTYFSEEAAEGGEDGCSSELRCHTFETFRNVYVQQVGGGNARFRIGDRSYVGLTGYGARNYFTRGDDVLEFAPSARQPIRRSFGAAGVEGGVGVGLLDVFGELTVTDRGAPAVLLRSLWDLDQYALEVTGRYYDRRFDNPFSRGESSPSQFLGMRSRNEAGIRARLVGKPIQGWRFIGYADTWVHPGTNPDFATGFLDGRHDYDIYLRNEIDLTQSLRWSFWGEVFDKDFRVGGRDQDYTRTPSVDYDEIYEAEDPDRAMEDLLAGQQDLARGIRMDSGTQFTFKPSSTVTLSAYGRIRWRDISTYDEYFERNVSTWFRVAVKPRKWLDVSTRVRYWDDDIDSVKEDRDEDGFLDYERGNAFVEGYLRLGVSFPKKLRANLRYDLRTFTDVKTRDEYTQHLIRTTVEVPF